jgi:hypothetical protein
MKDVGKSAPNEPIEELLELADHFDQRMAVDTYRAYHFGPIFLVELRIPRFGNGIAIRNFGRPKEAERCFVLIDYETRDYDG